MKYVILILFVLICGYIGYGLSAYYKNRSKFFSNMILMFEKMNVEINFSQNKLIKILQDFSCGSKDVNVLKNNFINCLELDLPIKNEELFKGIKILGEEERSVITMFFVSLGKFDVVNQTRQLDTQKEQIKLFFENAKTEEKKYSPLYIKLGVIIGLAVALIFL